MPECDPVGVYYINICHTQISRGHAELPAPSDGLEKVGLKLDFYPGDPG